MDTVELPHTREKRLTMDKIFLSHETKPPTLVIKLKKFSLRMTQLESLELLTYLTQSQTLFASYHDLRVKPEPVPSKTLRALLTIKQRLHEIQTKGYGNLDLIELNKLIDEVSPCQKTSSTKR